MKISFWMTVLSGGITVLLGPSLGEAVKGCDVEVTTSSHGSPKEFSMKSHELHIWFKADEECEAKIKINKDVEKEKTWTVNNTDTWLELVVKQPIKEIQARVLLPSHPNGLYVGFETVSSVQFSSSKAMLWSTCDMTSATVDHEDRECSIKIVAASLGAGLLFLLMVIMVLVYVIVRDRKRCRMGAKAKTPPLEMSLRTIKGKDNDLGGGDDPLANPCGSPPMPLSSTHVFLPSPPPPPPTPPTPPPPPPPSGNPDDDEYAEWDEDYMKKFRGCPSEPPSSSQVHPTRRPGSSHESLNSIYGTIIPE